jgi:hypothetical protein
MTTPQTHSRSLELITILAALALTAAGCNLTTKGGGPPPGPCAAGRLVGPELLAPDWVRELSPGHGTLWILDTTTPTLTWEYPDDSCYPDHYVVEVASSSDFAPENIVESGGNVGESYRWPPGRELEVGRTYYWHVAAVSIDGVQGPWSYRAILYIGPYCPEGDYEPEMLSPADGARVRTLDPLLKWEYPDAECLVPWTVVQVSRSSSFEESDTVETSSFHYTYEVQPMFSLPDGTSGFENCERYYWRIRDFHGVEFTSAWSFLVNTTGLFCPLDLGPVITPIGPEIPLPAGIPELTPLEEVNCRMGPGTAYEVVTRLPVGAQFPINGRNGDSTWWYVKVPASGQFCWVWGDLVETSGDTSNVPVQEATQLGCWVQDNPQFPKRCVVPCPPNAYPGGTCTP